MTFSPLRPFGLVGVIAVAGAMLLGSPALAASALPSQAPADETGSVNYVALGDSYAAGLGLVPLTGEPVPGCAQAEQNYPHRVAEALGLNLTDVSCTDAASADITSQAQVTSAGTAPIQSGSLGADTDVVTVSIGGNDAGFIDIARACVAESRQGPVVGPDQSFSAPNCRSIFVQDGVDSIAARIDGPVTAAVSAAYAKIRAVAPNAKVIVVGYPSILPDSANTPADGCFRGLLGTNGPTLNSAPFTDVDVPYLHQIEETLNAALARQAAAAGFTFVDNLTPTVTHSVCASAGQSYMNGITVTSLEPLGFAPGALHPNEQGVAFLASQVSSVVKTALAPPVAVPAGGEPAPAAVTPKLAETGFNGGTAFLIAGGLIVLAAILFITRAVLTKRRKAGS